MCWYNTFTCVSDKLSDRISQTLLILFQLVILVSIRISWQVWILNYDRKHVWLVLDWRFKPIYVLNHLNPLILEFILIGLFLQLHRTLFIRKCRDSWIEDEKQLVWAISKTNVVPTYEIEQFVAHSQFHVIVWIQYWLCYKHITIHVPGRIVVWIWDSTWTYVFQRCFKNCLIWHIPNVLWYIPKLLIPSDMFCFRYSIFIHIRYKRQIWWLGYFTCYADVLEQYSWMFQQVNVCLVMIPTIIIYIKVNSNNNIDLAAIGRWNWNLVIVVLFLQTNFSPYLIILAYVVFIDFNLNYHIRWQR